jgi:hypothetical protein
MRLQASTTALVALALALAGCGGDEAGETGASTGDAMPTAPSGETPGDTGATTSDPASEADQHGAGDVPPAADAVCAELRSELAAVEGELDEADSSADFVAAIDGALPGLEDGVAALEALAEADSDGALAQLAAVQRAAIEVLGKMRDAAAAEDVEGIQAHARDLEGLSAETERLARRAGLGECGGR